MQPVDLFNYKKEEFETVETFAKRVYDTAKRCDKSLCLNYYDSWKVVSLLAKYYKVSSGDIISSIKHIEYCKPSKKYRVLWVQCLGKHYLDVSKRLGC